MRAPAIRQLRPFLGLAAAALVAALPALAQSSSALDEHCTVSALNRSAQVQPDGTWVLPNVPANVGQVRVRATCLENGVTRSGQSDFVIVPPNGVIQVPSITFDAPAPVPASLALAAGTTVLTSAGQTVQLTATATMADGSSADVSAAAAGSGYRSSNPAIASVDAGGLVTAHTSGTVLLSALNEGALAVLTLRVTLSGDSDGDGLPDDYELAHGLDPNNPADAVGDPDGDGLSNLAELQLGTDPANPDSDGDGLLDGAEVNAVGTDPRLFDTDGDGVSDGLEVQAGSDPLDPASVDLGPILASLAVAPANFTLIYNTALGEGSQRLTVTATLIDGTVLDVTGGPYGTSYSSSDLAIVSFGSEPGRLFAGQAGTATVTATNHAASAVSTVTVEVFSPQALAFLPIPGFPNAVALAGGYAFVAAGRTGLQVADISSLSAPFLVASVPLPGNAFDIVVAGDYAYVASARGGLQVVDVHTPSAPVVVGSAATPTDALGIAVAGERAYVADGRGLLVFDVSSPSAPALLGGVDTPGRARGVDVSGTYAVVADESKGVEVIDVSDPSAPAIVGSTATRADSASNAADIVVRDRLAYVADGAAGLGGVKVVDFSVPDNPVVVGASSDAFGLNRVALDHDVVVGADYYFVNAVPIFGLATRIPSFQAVVDFSGPPLRRDDNGHGIAARDGAVFLGAVKYQTTNFGTYGDGGLYIGLYALFPEELAIPPTAEITFPADGGSVAERQFLTVTAQAFDDIRVDAVRFEVNGVTVGTDYVPPFEYTFTVPDGVSQLVLRATAVDLGGHEGSSDPVTVIVVPDNDPTIRLLTPLNGAHAIEGTTVKVAAEATDDVSVTRVELYIGGALSGIALAPPYAFELPLPIDGTPGLEISVVAVDSQGQTATDGPVTLTIDPDRPPAVAILSPTDGTEIPAGGSLHVEAGATDDQGVALVRLLVDGAEVAASSAPPYEHTFRVDPSSSDVHIAAVALDSRGHETTSPEVVVHVIPDPGTTVSGRVVEVHGAGVAAAAVTCLTAHGSTLADGTFSLPGASTVSGRVVCTAASAGAGGTTLSGSSPTVPPQPGGVTDVGDIVLAPGLLYLSSGDPGGFSPPGRIYVLDDAAGRLLPWSEPIEPAGFAALAFDGSGHLFGADLESVGISLRSDRSRQAAVGGISFGLTRSHLFQVDADRGETAELLGTIIDSATGGEVGIQDLAFDPLSGRLYALDAEGFGGDHVYVIDPLTASATPLLAGLGYQSGGLAFGPDGLLYAMLSAEPAAQALHARRAPASSPSPLQTVASPLDGSALLVLDPGDGTILDQERLAELDGLTLGGMTLQAATGTFLFTAGRELFEIDPATLLITDLGPLGAASDVLGLDIRPLTTPPVATTIRGAVHAEDGLAVAGATVSYLGASTRTGPDGSFELDGASVATGLARVIVEAEGEIAFSAAVPPVAGGITGVGSVVISSPACVSGALEYGGTCLSGPVAATLDLSVLDELDQWQPVGPVSPDLAGSFCATLRRGRSYRLHEENVQCPCGVTTCDGYLELTDPGAAGRCTDAAPQCEDLGTVLLYCDLDCGP